MGGLFGGQGSVAEEDTAFFWCVEGSVLKTACRGAVHFFHTLYNLYLSVYYSDGGDVAAAACFPYGDDDIYFVFLEFIDWVVEHSKQLVNNKKKYASKLKEMFLKNELNEWESSYRGMLMYKYAFSSEEIDAMKMEDGRYKDFSLKVAQKRLFDE